MIGNEDRTMRADLTMMEVWPGWHTVDKIGEGSYGYVYKIQRETLGYLEYAAVKYISIPKDPSEIAALRKNGYDEESITENYRTQATKFLDEYRLISSLRGNTNIVDCDDIRAVPHEDGIGTSL